MFGRRLRGLTWTSARSKTDGGSAVGVAGAWPNAALDVMARKPMRANARGINATSFGVKDYSNCTSLRRFPRKSVMKILPDLPRPRFSARWAGRLWSVFSRCTDKFTSPTGIQGLISSSGSNACAVRLGFSAPRLIIRSVDPGLSLILTSTWLADQTPFDSRRPKYVNSFTIPEPRTIFSARTGYRMSRASHEVTDE